MHPAELLDLTLRLEGYGFDFGIGEKYEGPSGYLIVSDLMLAIPLTLGSVYLLLSKPRKSTSKKITEPITGEGK